MRVKSNAPKEDPETAALRAVEEARAEADQTAATQNLLTRRTKRVLRVFGRMPAGGFGSASGGGAGSGASGVPARPARVSAPAGAGRTSGFASAYSTMEY